MKTSTALARTAKSEVEVLVHVRLGLATPPATFETFLLGEPGVVHAWRTAGDIDFEFRPPSSDATARPAMY